MFRKLALIGLLFLVVGMIGLAVSDAAPLKSPKTGTIVGLVLDELGDPVAGATVQLYANFPGYIDWVAQTTSGGDGKFSFKRVGPGDYTINAHILSPGFILMGTAPVTVVAGQTASVTVVVYAY